MKDKIQKIIENLKAEREEYGERIVSLHYAYDSAIKQLEELFADKVLKWSNGVEWGEIEHPDLGKVMTYWRAGTPCYDTYTAPMVDQDGDIYCHRFCQDDGVWKDTIWIGEYDGEEEIAFR